MTTELNSRECRNETTPTSTIRRSPRWNSVFAGWALALSLGAIYGVPTHAQETLTLQGPNPQLTFDDNSGVLQMWNVFGDNTGFDIIDPTAGTSPFHIEPGTLDNSLVLGANGLVGFGAVTPSTELHVSTSGLIPTLRLQTTGAVPRAWDLQGSGGGFHILDVTNSNASPFGVLAGAPTNSLLVGSTGRVSVGVATALSQFHTRAPAISGAEFVARFDVSDDAVGRIEIVNATSTDGRFQPRFRGAASLQAVPMSMEGIIGTDVGANGAVVFNAAVSTGGGLSVRPLVLYQNNNVTKVTVAANGNVTATAFINASSRSLKDNIVDLDSRKAQEALRQLTPVEFTYKDDATADHRVGFIAEDVPDIIAEADRKSVPIMDVVALVTRVVKDQQLTIDEQKKFIEEQRKLNDALMKRLAQLEGQMPEQN